VSQGGTGDERMSDVSGMRMAATCSASCLALPTQLTPPGGGAEGVGYPEAVGAGVEARVAQAVTEGERRRSRASGVTSATFRSPL